MIAAAVAGFIVTALALVRPPPARRRANFREREVPVLGALLALPLAVGGVVAPGGAWAVVAAGIALGLLGLLDDLYGDRSASGFLGHLRMLARGRVTTGVVKAVGGGVVGLGCAWAVGAPVLAGGAVVALSANLCNLLDLRPGRAGKVWLASWAALLGSGPTDGALVASAGLAGGVVAFLPSDLRERAMLGDAGANLMGGVAGAVAVSSLARTGLLVLLGVLAALTAASELVSFNRVIERAPVLRSLDRLGRLP